MPVFGICLQIIPVILVLLFTALLKAICFPFSAMRLLHRSRAARA